MKRSLLILALLVFPVSALAQAPAHPTPTLSAAEVLDKVRAAVGYRELTKLRHGLVIAGAAEYLDLQGRFRWRYAPDGRFSHEIDGRLAMAIKWDGERGWISNWSGIARQLELEDLESMQTEFWIITGRWLAPETPLQLSLPPDQSNERELLLRVKIKGGRLEAQLTLDRLSWLPTNFKYLTRGKTDTWQFTDYRRAQGLLIPHTVTNVNLNIVNRYRIESVAKAAESGPAQFSMSSTPPGDTVWKTEAAAEVEVKRARSGHLLVKPLIDGKEVGWFILDSGAGAMVVTPAIGEKLGMASFGRVPVKGIGGTLQTPFRRGKSFELGPLMIKDPLFIEVDFTQISQMLGETISGVCGYDLFSRAVVALSPARAELAIYDPRSYELPEGSWQEMMIDHNIPHLRCRFEGDHEDVFRLDTGADNTVSFHSPAVEKYKLLDGRQTQTGRTGGVGGMSLMRRGKLAWFEIAGHRFKEPDAIFSLAQEGAFANGYVAGNIGNAFLSPFRIIFNYPRRQIAMIR